MEKQKKQAGSIEFSLGMGQAKKIFFLYKYRIVIVCLFAWLPLFVLSIFDGVLITGAKVPFIYDLDAHIRFLISLALLLYADEVTNAALDRVVKQFVNCNIIELEDTKKFKLFIASAKQISSSIIAQTLILLLVIISAIWFSRNLFSFKVSAWYGSHENHIRKLTIAGYWYAYVSLPIFQFILLRWYYRIAIWYRFLWQVSRLPLKLNSLHPDRTGGIGFLGVSMFAFLPILIAHSVLLSGMIYNHIWHEGAKLSQYYEEIIGMIILLTAMPLVPLIFYIVSLVKTKQYGTFSYAITASNYVNGFRHKWIDKQTKDDQLSMLGTPDLQSLADLFNSFQVSWGMRIIPFERKAIILLIILVALPFLPLLFTDISVDKIIHRSIGFIFK